VPLDRKRARRNRCDVFADLNVVNGVKERLGPETVTTQAAALSTELGISLTVATWLYQIGHRDPVATRRFLDPKLADLTRPDGMADRDVAAARLACAIQRRERVCVFGDYDCDGITAAAIMTEVIRALGGEVLTKLASRFEGGYGVSAAALRGILASGASVVVTCDCGSSDHASLAELKRLGIDVIVIDHHLVPAEPLPALAFLNPHRPDCAFPYKGLASCGLALSVDRVAIGTVADVAPLDGDNRALVRAGLRALGRAERPGIRALLELAKLEPAPPGAEAITPLTSEDIAFRLAPRINAPGRLGSPDLALELLLANTGDSARLLGEQLEQITLERKALQEKMVAEAVAEIEREKYHDRPAIVIGREGWNPGLVGVAAARVADRYGRPVIVIGFEGARGRGSVRGPQGARLFEALSSCGEMLERFGGHTSAAGLEVKLGRLDELRERFEHACKSLSVSSDSQSSTNPVAYLFPEDDPARVLADLGRLEPCGPTNPAPRFRVEATVCRARDVRGGHLQLELELAGGRRMAAFGAGQGHLAERLGGQVVAVGKLRKDRWRGGDAVELGVESVETRGPTSP
jgi:single-stranded-DNA-specific exonuclease